MTLATAITQHMDLIQGERGWTHGTYRDVRGTIRYTCRHEVGHE